MTNTMQKKKIFIGSSSEATIYLSDVKKILSDDFDVIAWNDPNVFSLNNQPSLDSLIKQSYLVDFAIFLATSDDVTNSRGKEQAAPRDNVIFEFGMFLQSLGKERCFMLVEKEVKVLSDMTGITLNYFKKSKDNACFNYAVTNLKTNLLQKKKHIPSLVTTGLSYGYYKNFVKKLVSWKECEKLVIYLSKADFNPDDYKKNQQQDLPVRQAFSKLDDCKKFVDYPTTLDVIDEIINHKSELSEAEKNTYRKREIQNFQLVIERLSERENFKNKICFL